MMWGTKEGIRKARENEGSGPGAEGRLKRGNEGKKRRCVEELRVYI